MNKRPLKLATITLAASCAAAVAVAVFADPSNGRRSERGQGTGGERVDRGDRGDRDHGPGGWQGQGPDWNSEQFKQFREQLEKFCEKHSPNRWNDLKNVSNRSSRVGGMAMRFAGLKQLQKEDQTLYDIKVKLIEIEDQEYGLLKDLKTAEKDNPDNVKALQAQLQAKSQEYIAQRLLERSHRLAKLNEFLKSEQKKLDADQHDQDKQTEERVKQMIAEGTDFFTPKPPFRHGEGGGDGGRGPTTVRTPPSEPKQ